jgi:hypothetical protein
MTERGTGEERRERSRGRRMWEEVPMRVSRKDKRWKGG